MGQIDKKLRKEFDATRKNPKYLCNAPFCSMYISLTEQISPCMQSCFKIEDNVIEKSIKDAWNGSVFSKYRKQIKNNFLPEACDYCESRLRNGEFYRIPIREYDDFEVKRFGKNKVQIIKLYISNACNLKCIMCDETNSSQFAQKDTYKKCELDNSKIMDELTPLIPDLKVLTCFGGEPFFIKEHYPIWDKIIKINPKCEIYTITNATILNDRIKQLLEHGNFKIQCSLNSLKKDVYEKIHVNANFENVMKNIDYFGSTMKKQSKTFVIHTCALKINRYEIPDIVKYCNEHSYLINIRPVYKIIDVALWDLSSEQLKEMKDFYMSQRIIPNNEIAQNNAISYNNFISNIDTWIKDAERKENFENIFDLGTDKVMMLKSKFYDRINHILELSNPEKTEYQRKYNFVFTKLERIMQTLPDYFQTNHFYQVMTTVSPKIMLEYIMLANDETVKRLLEGCFYYCGWNH